MDIYTDLTYKLSRDLTLAYSTSFGLSSKLFGPSIRHHIYAIYGLVRVTDEIVDTYTGDNPEAVLNAFEAETYIAMTLGYSTNPIVHSFAQTARKFHIPKKNISAFFKSMRLDLTPQTYTQNLYETYIYGSAEVIGLMCLRVFCNNNLELYASLEDGARALGAAYQKVNFLRDFASDYITLHRTYFPNVDYESFNEKTKMRIIKDINNDLYLAKKSLLGLPKTSRIAVKTSLTYYKKLLDKIERTPAHILKQKRIRINNAHKLVLLGSTIVSESFKK